MVRDAEIDHARQSELDDEEQIKWAEEKIDQRQDITGPDVLCMTLEKNGPRRIRRSVRTGGPHVLLNGGGGDLNPELDEFPSDARRSPESIFLGHLS